MLLVAIKDSSVVQPCSAGGLSPSMECWYGDCYGTNKYGYGSSRKDQEQSSRLWKLAGRYGFWRIAGAVYHWRGFYADPRCAVVQRTIPGGIHVTCPGGQQHRTNFR